MAWAFLKVFVSSHRSSGSFQISLLRFVDLQFCFNMVEISWFRQRQKPAEFSKHVVKTIPCPPPTEVCQRLTPDCNQATNLCECCHHNPRNPPDITSYTILYQYNYNTSWIRPSMKEVCQFRWTLGGVPIMDISTADPQLGFQDLPESLIQSWQHLTVQLLMVARRFGSWWLLVASVTGGQWYPLSGPPT